MIARSLARPARADSRGRMLRIALGALLAALLMLALAAPAGAVIEEVEAARVGLQPRNETTLMIGENEYSPSGAVVKRPAVSQFGNNSGNAVLHGTKVYGIYWDPNNTMHHEWTIKIDQFLHRLGASSGSLENIYADLGQYRDRSNTGASYQTVFMGAYHDTSHFPAVAGCTDPAPLVEGQQICLTDAQVREQLQSFVTTHGLPTGMNTVFYVMTPPGVTVCLDKTAEHCSDYSVSKAEAENGERESTSFKNGFCSYHGDINTDNAPEGDAKTILYGAIPWTAGYSGFPEGFLPKAFDYVQAQSCQDGGWNPTEHFERYEHAKEPDKGEQEILNGEKGTPEERHALEERIRLEEPHQQEPNQEGKAEEADFGAGLADLTVNQIAVEQANIVTDPLLESWHDPEGREVTDECRNTFAGTVGASGGEIGGAATADEHTEAGTLSNEHFGTADEVGVGSYYINNAFSLSTGGCVGGAAEVARFTIPDPVNVDEIVGVDGMESTVQLIKGEAFGLTGLPTTTYAKFSWNFGDGTPEVTGYAPGAPPCESPWLSPCAAAAFHLYSYGGTYKVTLIVTDVAGNVSVVTHDVTVNGPPAPAVTPGSAGASPGSSGGSKPGSKGGTPIVAPVAAAVVASHSLRKVVHKGLVVNYSVNEKVAGHFEVLISAALAHKLKLGGAPAVGLPAGTPPEVVIAKAFLVTTRGGHSTIVIHFSKRTNERLGRAGRASLMLRLIVRDAASTSPQTATVLSSATLGR